jgi:hypothetical protein
LNFCTFAHSGQLFSFDHGIGGGNAVTNAVSAQYRHQTGGIEPATSMASLLLIC